VIWPELGVVTLSIQHVLQHRARPSRQGETAQHLKGYGRVVVVAVAGFASGLQDGHVSLFCLLVLASSGMLDGAVVNLQVVFGPDSRFGVVNSGLSVGQGLAPDG